MMNEETRIGQIIRAVFGRELKRHLRRASLIPEMVGPGNGGSDGFVLTLTGGSGSWANLNSAIYYSVVTCNTNTTITAADELVLVTAAVTITLPASPTAGQSHVVKDYTGIAQATPITVSGNGKNIDGLASVTLTVNYESQTFVYGGSAWAII